MFSLNKQFFFVPDDRSIRIYMNATDVSARRELMILKQVDKGLLRKDAVKITMENKELFFYPEYPLQIEPTDDVRKRLYQCIVDNLANYIINGNVSASHLHNGIWVRRYPLSRTWDIRGDNLVTVFRDTNLPLDTHLDWMVLLLETPTGKTVEIYEIEVSELLHQGIAYYRSYAQALVATQSATTLLDMWVGEVHIEESVDTRLTVLHIGERIFAKETKKGLILRTDVVGEIALGEESERLDTAIRNEYRVDLTTLPTNLEQCLSRESFIEHLKAACEDRPPRVGLGFPSDVSQALYHINKTMTLQHPANYWLLILTLVAQAQQYVLHRNLLRYAESLCAAWFLSDTIDPEDQPDQLELIMRIVRSWR